MKRCSQCEFIYEDDQHLCDMDGHELVYEPTLQFLQINAPTKPSSGHARRFGLAAVLAILLATLLSVGYSGFTSEYAPQNTKAPSTNVVGAPEFPPAQTQPPAEPIVSPTQEPHNQEVEKSTTRTTVATPIAENRPRIQPIPQRRQAAQPQPERANHKTRIGGFLKKTGKILKRPFKF